MTETKFSIEIKKIVDNDNNKMNKHNRSCNQNSVIITSHSTSTYSITHIAHPSGPIDKGLGLDEAARGQHVAVLY